MLRQFFATLKPSMLGLAFVHMWIYCSTHRFLPSDGVSVTVALYSAMSLALAMLAVGLWRSRHRVRASGPKAPGIAVDVVAALCMAYGAVALCVELPLPAGVAAATGAALGGIGVAWAYGRWIQVYACFDLRFSAPLIFFTMIVGSSCKTVIDLLPGQAAAIVLACLPFAAFACARRARVQTPPAPVPAHYYNHRTVGSLGRVVGGVAAFSLTTGIIQAAYQEAAPSPYLAAVLVNHVTEIVIALAVIGLIAVARRRLDFGRTWRLLLILMTAALILEPHLQGTQAYGLLFSLVRTAHALLVVYFLFLAIADVARHSSYDPLAVYAVGWLAYTLPFTLGNVMGLVMEKSSCASLLVAGAAWTLIAVALVVFDDRSLGNQLIFAELNADAEDVEVARRIGAMQQSLETQVAQPERPADRLRVRCQELARKNGLTQREREVLELLIRGHNKTRIAETFLISENTVRGHVKHIYAKLSVHSKQELLDVFEGK